MPVDDDKLSEVVKALSLLQVTVQQPWCRDLMAKIGLAVQPVESEAVKAARDGNPSSSKPGPVLPTPAPSPSPTPAQPAKAPEPGTVSTPAEETPADATPDETPPVEAEADTSSQVVINSSTHRAAHARLARRMASLGDAECPNMSKLWAGSRKDCFFNVRTYVVVETTFKYFCF